MILYWIIKRFEQLFKRGKKYKETLRVPLKKIDDRFHFYIYRYFTDLVFDPDHKLLSVWLFACSSGVS